MKFLTTFNALIVILLMQISFSVQADVMPADFRHKISDKAWEENIRTQNFQDREIIEGATQDIIELKAPYTAEDASLVPISLHTKIKQTKERYIKKVHIFVDMNPLPLAGIFEFTQDSGKADIAMRIRVDTFAYVRAVAELNTGELYMSKSFVRAKGACSAPPPPGAAESRKLLGKMKMKVVGDLIMGEPNLMQVKVRHPNVTGLAPLKIGSRIIPPPWFVDTLEVTYNGKLIVKAYLTFTVSMDPALRFYFVPEKEGVMTVKGTDTKKNEFSHTYEVKSA
ncbi:MAG TPA: quinoprotein dehydrogenase-associated SoxYZ-like carrier [Thiotrichaceae bacterium]|jgi:sulfur-oxidizing protein SoxY|nr:quinoprotein dehydrogenase-associated SoxYZ-like carrier [Thiotrichaceae bacterium]HIM09157.1 quinoprotein dehydrogenase-associated SoxYZ-like carrier [Gammaproteobacteria bacterium]